MTSHGTHGVLGAAAAFLAVLLAPGAPSLPAQEEAPSVGHFGGWRWEITPEVEQSARRALAWLAARQEPGGYWGSDIGYKLNNTYQVTRVDSAHIGITAVALMAFLAGGHVPGRGEYGHVMDRGTRYLVNATTEDGYITDNGSRMYSHAFATLYLAEVYGMTRRDDVRGSLQRAVDLIVNSQNAEGGWRYHPFGNESDISITVCQVMALRAARNIGIRVPFSTIDAAVRYVRDSAVREAEPRMWGYGPMDMSEPGAFRYQRTPGSRATFPLTAAGVTTLFGAGVYDDPLVEPALEYMKSVMPRFNRIFPTHYFFYYGHYYAVQAFFMAGGSHWTWYYRRMRDHFLRTQLQDGSWMNDVGPGSVFATGVAALVLQVPYQYLPILQR